MEAGRCSLCHQAQAKFTCSCVFPALPMCSACTLPHLETEGAHMPVPVQRQAAPILPVQGEGNQVCDECRNRAAAHFCLCAVPLRKFCAGCDMTHYQKAPNQAHFKHPIAAYQTVASGKIPIEEFRRKQLYINDLQLRIGGELANFDEFARRVEGEFDALLEHIAAKKKALLQDLLTERVKIARVLNEIQHTIDTKRYSEACEVVTSLDELIVNGYLNPQLRDLTMFTGKMDLKGVRELLETSIAFTFSPDVLQENDVYIPLVKGNILRRYKDKSFEMTQLTLNQTTRIDNASSCCKISADVFLYCGGNSHNEVYEVNTLTGTVEKRANMISIRIWAGSSLFKGEYVFVFGNNSGDVTYTAEKYSLATKSWTNIPNRSPKPMEFATACTHISGIYIAAIEANGSSVEFFNPQNETFTLLKSDSFRSVTTICCIRDELYCIRLNKVEVASLTNGPRAAAFTVKATATQITLEHFWLCSPVALLGEELVGIIHNTGAVCNLFSFSPAKASFTRVTNITY